MNCPVFVAFKAEREAKEAARKAATKAADQRAYRKTGKYRKYRQRCRVDPSCKWTTFVAQARRRQIKVELTKGQYMGIVVKPCAYCGECKADKLRGIDRLDSDGVYSPHNTAACCAGCNFMKGSRPVAEFMRKTRDIVGHSLEPHTRPLKITG